MRPSDDKDMQLWAKKKGYSFKVFDNVKCNHGKQTHDLYKFLANTQKVKNNARQMPAKLGQVKDNFEKFLCDERGYPMAKYGSDIMPSTIGPRISRMVH